SRISGADAADAFVALRRMNLALFESLSDADRQTALSHPEYGALTVDWILHLIAGHPIHHPAHPDHVAPSGFAEGTAFTATHERGVLTFQINVFNEASPAEDYRIPDIVFIAAGREQILARDGTRGGGPDAVIEVRSPEEETYDKFPFFTRIGVREAIVVHRDT